MSDLVEHRPRPVTPDGRYFVAGGRLFRKSNPALTPEERKRLTFELIAARSAAMHARRRQDAAASAAALDRVTAAKTALGQSGPPWWADAAPDLSRQPARGTTYADWFSRLAPHEVER